MIEQTAPAISTVELLKAGWPIVVFAIAVVWALITQYFATKSHEKFIATTYVEDRKSIFLAIKDSGDDFTKFKDRDYPEDKKMLLDAVQKLQASQEQGERRMEDKLDKMESKTDSKMQQIYVEVNSTNKLLAELKGRLYHNDSQGPKA